MASLEDMPLETRDELALLARQLAENPATRKDFLRLTRKAKPDLPIPELDIEDTSNKLVERAEERVKGLEAKLQERDAKEDLEKRRSNLIKKGLASEEDLPEIEKVMLEKGIVNHEAAAEYFAWMKQAATPTPTGYNPHALSKIDFKSFAKNPVQAARQTAFQALTDLRKSPRPPGL